MYKFFKKPVNQKLGPLRSNLYTLHAASIVDHSQTQLTESAQLKEYFGEFQNHLQSTLGGSMTIKAASSVVARLMVFVSWKHLNIEYKNSKQLYDALKDTLRNEYTCIGEFCNYVELNLHRQPSTVMAYLDSITHVSLQLHFICIYTS